MLSAAAARPPARLELLAREAVRERDVWRDLLLVDCRPRLDEARADRVRLRLRPVCRLLRGDSIVVSFICVENLRISFVREARADNRGKLRDCG